MENDKNYSQKTASVESVPFKLAEFLGPVGSGKTTLYPWVKKIFHKYDKKVLGNKEGLFFSLRNELNSSLKGKALKFIPQKIGKRAGERLFYKSGIANKYTLEYIQEHLEFFHFILSMQNKRPISRVHKKEITKWFLYTGCLYQFYKKNLDSRFTLIFEEGFIHGRAINLFVSSEEEIKTSLIQQYLQMIPPLDVLIYVDAGLEICFSRLKSRGLPLRLKGAKDEEVIKFIQNSIIVSEVILDLIEKNFPDTYIIKVNNSGHLSSAVSLFEQKIEDYRIENRER